MIDKSVKRLLNHIITSISAISIDHNNTYNPFASRYIGFQAFVVRSIMYHAVGPSLM